MRSPDAAAMLSPLVSAAYINDKGLEEILQILQRDRRAGL